MKKRNLNKGFALNKRTVANLSDYEQVRVVAGGERCELTQCVFSNSAVLFSSTEYVDTQGNIMPADRRKWPCLMNPTTITIADE